MDTEKKEKTGEGILERSGEGHGHSEERGDAEMRGAEDGIKRGWEKERRTGTGLQQSPLSLSPPQKGPAPRGPACASPASLLVAETRISEKL